MKEHPSQNNAMCPNGLRAEHQCLSHNIVRLVVVILKGEAMAMQALDSRVWDTTVTLTCLCGALTATLETGELT